MYHAFNCQGGDKCRCNEPIEPTATIDAEGVICEYLDIGSEIRCRTFDGVEKAIVSRMEWNKKKGTITVHLETEKP